MEGKILILCHRQQAQWKGSVPLQCTCDRQGCVFNVTVKMKLAFYLHSSYKNKWCAAEIQAQGPDLAPEVRPFFAL